VLEKLVNDYPSVPSFHHHLAEALHGRAITLHEEGKPADARPLLERAVAEQQLALKAEPGNRTYRKQLRGHCFGLAEVLVGLKEHPEASKAALALAGLADGELDYRLAAWKLAECVALAERDDRLPPDKRKESAEAYGRQAVELLRVGAKKGGVSGGSIGTEEAFAPLRSQADFNQLLRELGAKPKGEPVTEGGAGKDLLP
jgi:hypothetical protein